MSPNDDAYRLLAEYAAGNLTESERTQLMQAALADAEIFEALVEEEALRDALDDGVFRRQVKEQLRALGAEREPFWARIWQYVASPKGMLATAGALASVALVVLVQTGVFKPTPALLSINLSPPGMGATTAADLTEGGAPVQLKSLTPQQTVAQDAKAAILQLDRTGNQPSYQIGDRQRIGFRLEHDGNAVLLEDSEGGGSNRLFPNRFQELSAVRGGETILVPPDGQGDIEVAGPVGGRVLRLIVFPPGVNPLAGDAWERLLGQAKEVRLTYSVKGKP